VEPNRGPRRQRRLAGRQNRLWIDLELRFHKGAVLAGGVNGDLDLPRDKNFFDGAHGRILWPL
jgi:hypothetical protein